MSCVSWSDLNIVKHCWGSLVMRGKSIGAVKHYTEERIEHTSFEHDRSILFQTYYVSQADPIKKKGGVEYLLCVQKRTKLFYDPRTGRII